MRKDCLQARGEPPAATPNGPPIEGRVCPSHRGHRRNSLLALLWQIPLIMGVLACLYNPWAMLAAHWSGDDASYLSHAFSLGMDLDLDYSNELVAKTGPMNPRHGVPVHPIGVGLLAGPWVGVCSLVDRIQGHPVVRDHTVTQRSWAIFGFFMASSLALLAGACLYVGALEELGLCISRGFILLLLAATGVPYYGLQRFAMGHSFEFLTIALVVWGTVRWTTCRDGRCAIPGVATAAGIVLTLAVRPSDVNVLILPPLVGLISMSTSREIWLRRPWRAWLAACATLGLGIGMLMTLNSRLYGISWPSMSDLYGPAEGRLPEGGLDRVGAAVRGIRYLLPVLFSSEFGLLYSAPVIPIGIGLLFMCRNGLRPTWRLSFVGCLLAYAAIPLAIVILWRSTASAYGYRYLLSLVAPGVLGFATWHAHASRWIRRVVVGVIGVLCVLSLAGQAFFQTSPALSVHPQVNVFGKQHRYSANGYVTELTREVCRRDAWTAMLLERLPGFVMTLRTGATAREVASMAAWGFNGRRFWSLVRVAWKCPTMYSGAMVAFFVLYALASAWLVVRRGEPVPECGAERQSRVSP